MKILIDNGHGVNTRGKASPDGTLQEATYTRKLAVALQQSLQSYGISSHLIVPEQDDIPLSERIRRVNAITDADALISLHINAAGNGDSWYSASGFTVFTALSASEHSYLLAKKLTAAARSHNILGNRYIPQEDFLRANFAILRGTRCPAVLTENMFMDSTSDLKFLKSENGFNTLIKVHTDAILDFAKDTRL